MGARPLRARFFRTARCPSASSMQNGLWLGMYPPFSTTRCPSRNLTAAWGREHINEIQSRATKRTGPVRVDFGRLISRDTLISNPPRSITSDLGLIGWIDEVLDGVIGRLLF